MKVSTALPTGVAALLFESARARRRVEGRVAGVVGGQGYVEAILPILDYLEPYGALLTPASRGELYRFIDRDGEQLALRADFTPMLARLLAPRLHSLRLPLRLFYRGDVVRYEESRPGSRRELYQMGVELLGMAGRGPGRRPPAGGRRGDLGPAAAAGLRWLLALRDELATRFPAVRLSVDLAEFARFSRHPDLAAAAGARSYYDGLVFRAYAGAAAVPVGGGGHYGSLFRALGAGIAAVGFSINLDGLLEVDEVEALLPERSPKTSIAAGEEG